MSHTRNYIIAGGRGKDPANLSVNMEPVKLSEDMTIAVKSISYGEVWNVNELNNSIRVHFKSEYLGEILNITKINTIPDSEDPLNVTLKIPNGRYNLADHVVRAITNTIDDHMDSMAIKSYCETVYSYGKVTVKLPKEIDYVQGYGESPLSLIDAPRWIRNQFSCHVGEIPSKAEMCFVYMNICQNSYINGKRSRLLCVFPVVSNKGYTFFEFRSPTYVPIEVSEFSKINVDFRNIRGEKMGFDNSYDTVVNLHVTKRQ
jgi:hypothetical protein